MAVCWADGKKYIDVGACCDYWLRQRTGRTVFLVGGLAISTRYEIEAFGMFLLTHWDFGAGESSVGACDHVWNGRVSVVSLVLGGQAYDGTVMVGLFCWTTRYFNEIDAEVGACDVFTDGAYENECSVGGVAHTPRYDIGMLCLDYVNNWMVYDAVGACIVIQYGFKM